MGFDDHIGVKEIAEGRYAAHVSPLYDVVGIPNGGYLMSMMANAALRESDQPHPLTLNTHFLSRIESDEPVEIEVSQIRPGRRFETFSVALHQNGRERARMLLTSADLDAFVGPTEEAPDRPILNEPHSYPHQGGPESHGPIEITRRFEYRSPISLDQFTMGQERERPIALDGWMKFHDGRRADLISLATVADACPPPIFARHPFSWVPTIEMTVHFRKAPTGDWLQVRFETNHVQNGLLEEDGYIWDETGDLVAMSRQLALYQQ